MNPSRSFLLTTVTALMTLLAAGCHRPHSEAKSEEHGHGDEHAEGATEHSEPGVSFKEGKGLHVPPETAKFIALRVEDVTDRQVKSTLRFSAQIYRAAGEAQFASLPSATSTTALASGQIGASDATGLRKGQDVTVETTDGKSLRGRITQLNPALGRESGQVEVILAVTDSDARLRQGTFLTVIVETGGGKTVVAVPKSALLRTAEGNFVYTVSGERFVRTPVKLGVMNHELAEITDGLYAGDQVVVQPVMTLWMAELQSIRGGKACADGH